MKRIHLYLVACAIIALANTSTIFAQSRATKSIDVPRVLSYQGTLATNNGKPLADGDYTITARLYSDAKGLNKVWEGAYSTSVRNGIFNLTLGEGGTPLPETNVMSTPLWTGIQVGESAEMRPLTPLSASPYAINVSNGAITKEKMGTDYVGSLSINGQKISERGADVNFVTGDGVYASVDPGTSNVVLSTDAAIARLKHGQIDANSVVNGTLLVTGQVTFSSLGAGIVHSSSGGVLTSSAVALAADVSGILPLANGGTGVDNSTGRAQHAVFSGPISGSGAASFRALDPTDVPTLNQNTTGNAATVTTNANLTGPVTSVGNATAIAANALSESMVNGLGTDLSTLTTNLNNEITARGAGDATLTTILNNEVTRATGAEGTLTTNLNNEITARGAGDASLTTNLNTEIADRQALDAAAVHLAGAETISGTKTFSQTIVGNISGNAAGSAASFTGSLGGDVTGTQAATVLANTAVTPGSYTSANLTVNAQGRITTAASGAPFAGIHLAPSTPDATSSSNPTLFLQKTDFDISGTNAQQIAWLNEDFLRFESPLFESSDPGNPDDNPEGIVTRVDATGNLVTNGVLTSQLGSKIDLYLGALPSSSFPANTYFYPAGRNPYDGEYLGDAYPGGSYPGTVNPFTVTSPIEISGVAEKSWDIEAHGISKFHGTVTLGDADPGGRRGSLVFHDLDGDGRSGTDDGTSGNDPKTLMLMTADALTADRTVTLGDFDGEATVQGNAFNGNSQLVQTTSGGLLPVISGENVTNIAGSNVIGAVANATSAVSFTGSLVGDVTGTQGATVVSTVGTSTAANVHTAELAANAATNANTASTIVKRDPSGNFSAGTISAALNGNASTATTAGTATSATTATTAANLSGTNLSGDVSNLGNAVTVATVGSSTAANIHSAEVAANAATNANTASTIVKRDPSGNFSAGTITANLTGNASGTAANVTGTVAIANGGTGTGTAPTAGGAIYAASSTALASTAAGNAGQVLTSTGASAPTWQTVAGTVPSGAIILFSDNNSHTGFTYTGSSILIVGNGNVWTTKTSMSTARAFLASAAPGNGKLYAIGGSNGTTYFATCEEYDPSTNAWTTKASMDSARSGLAAAAPGNGKLYAIGGRDGTFYTPRLEVYDPSTNTWTKLRSMNNGRYDLAAAAPGNGKIYVVGGTTNSGSTALDYCEEYDATTNLWTSKASMITPRFGLAAAAPGNGTLYAIGGSTSGTSATSATEQYNPSTDTWTAKASIISPRYYLAAAAPGNGKLYCVGGGQANGTNTSGVYEEYDLNANTWTQRTGIAGRGALTAAAPGNGKLYAIGGFNGGISLSTCQENAPPIVYYYFSKN